MKFGVCVPNYGTAFSVEGLGKFAREAEQLGFDSLWTTDHVLMPGGSGTPYGSIIDCVTSLGYLAALTKRVKLGTSVLIIAMRNPVVVAKQFATLDVLSDGRAILGVGTGWNEKEFGYLGSSFHDRGRRVTESLRLIQALWESKGGFEGRRSGVRFDGEVSFEPRPVQRHLPAWVGGTSDASMRRAAKLGDVWHPNVIPLEEFGKMIQRFRAIPGAEGKEVGVRIGVNLKLEHCEYVGQRGKALALSGNAAENRRVVEELSGLGVTRAVLVPSTGGETPLAGQLEAIKAIAREFL